MFLVIGFDLGCFSVYCLFYLVFLISREELKLARQHIESLLEQRDNLEKEIERQKAADNR